MAEPASPAPAPTPAAADLAKAPLDQALAALGVKTGSGLSVEDAAARLQKFGPNALAHKTESQAAKIAHYFMGPIAYMIEAAALVSAILGHWPDFAVVAGLLIFNAALDFWQDRKATNALAALKKGLAPEATVLRAGAWSIDAGGEPRPRRHRQDPPRRHRARRPAPRRRRLRGHRPVGADRRVAAGDQEGRRRGLFRQRRQAGRDGGRGHRHRQRTPSSAAPPSSSPAPARSATRRRRCSRSATS